MSRLVALALVVLSLIPLAGCWSRRETESLAVITAIGIDTAFQGEKKVYRVTKVVLAPKPGGGGPGGGGGRQGGGAKREYSVLTTEGPTIEEACRRLAVRLSRITFLDQIRVVLFGEEMSKEGVSEALDFLTRYQDIRLRTTVMVTRGQAETMLRSNPEFESEISREIKGFVDNAAETTAKIAESNLEEFTERVITPGEDAFAPVLERVPLKKKSSVMAESGETFLVKGMAMFSSDKLAGWLNEREVRGIWLAMGKAKQGDLSVEVNGNTVSYVFSKPKEKLRVRIDDEQNVTAMLNVRVSGGVAESQSQAVNTQEGLANVEKAVNAELEGVIRSALEKSKAAGSDIMGVGRLVEREDKALWNQIRAQWPQRYRQVEFEVKVESKVERIGLKNKPVQGKLLK